jgi:D-alanyl-D-alanine carboxypeptidase
MRKDKRKPERLLPFIALILLLQLPCAAAQTDAPGVSASAAVLMEQESGRVLFGLQEDTPLPIASITKIMTGLLAAEGCRPEEEVVIRPEWLGVEGSSMGLRAGETVTVLDLLYGLLLTSGNDAANALACHMAGDPDSFARLMNRRAAELGMANTRFLNPHGLSREGHRSTALDMARLTRAAMENELFARIVGTQTARICGKDLRNHNRLLWDYPGTVGVKTGYTESSGRTLVSCAVREGMTLICVTLNDPADWQDHKALLDWGFLSFRMERPEPAWQLQAVSGLREQVSLRPVKATGFPVPRDAEAEWRLCVPEFEYAPILEGQLLGEAVLYADGVPAGVCGLEAGETVEPDPRVPLDLWEKLRRAWYLACRNSAALSGMGSRS